MHQRIRITTLTVLAPLVAAAWAGCGSDTAEGIVPGEQNGVTPTGGPGVFTASDGSEINSATPAASNPPTPSSGSLVASDGTLALSPLGVGCGPETAHDCSANTSCPAATGDDYELVDSSRVCFFGEELETPAATVEHVIETYAGRTYAHVRVTLDPDFVDNVYGPCAENTGWLESKKQRHTFSDLLGSDHLELGLFECDGDLATQMKIDYLDEQKDTACGYRSAGVLGGDGKMIVGDSAFVLGATSSLDRNFNGCGYCETEVSPCPGEGYAPDATAPNWDFRVSYEVWVSLEAFDASGFCGGRIEFVHASPSKKAGNTIEVEEQPCPPDGGGGSGNWGCPPGWVGMVTATGELVCVEPM